MFVTCKDYRGAVLSKIIKYKLYHLPFWCIYFALLLSPFVLKLAFYIPIELAAAYFNLYFLIPHYLGKGRIGGYVVTLSLTLFLASACIVSGYYLTAFLMHTNVYQLYGPGLCSYYFFGNAVPAVFTCLAITTAIHLTKAWIQTRRKQQLLEREKLETELDFLKHQFNPHFLFNTINSIFFLIHKKPDTASESLARFSELLRYQLYECNDLQIPLSKEIKCLKNSIELEKLRLNDNMKVKVDLEPSSSTDHLTIAPFILMTFVENAFKHVSKETLAPNWINISLHLDENGNEHQLHLTVSNSIARNNLSEVIHHSGIGLRNVRRRLDLLYPGRHNLSIQNTSTSFEVHLQLELTSMHDSLPLPTLASSGKLEDFLQ
ncbi:MAG: histidine kinase [Bacteroidetes bacterium]|nr:histidine kinase [Bacteroidota bacterium]